ncbi:TPA: PhzF family phenazine biosynthesis protein [Staphylococcus delphini]|nr:PhzF family phenazine biosynthesis protein [Staphylococcus delphini]HEC2168937.1 PhzF family phenazine biosynthesis protein [Staphylococcus delphini]HEC2171337.1 PhzF family phenazine biosynthesis protein [Staphylococcus delphini]HEC2180847.1 PhzF family phenazine biosynthesis protein [Staphylococcus delphini]HEC2183563.1 PhzF family phenazine biosynthesis protein [Staphylococcus delphini]
MKQYVVDAFTNRVFTGNPAAVCILDEWLDDQTMLLIAQENNLSETAFSVKQNGKYQLRWFTPGGEIDLCGHATLATTFILMNEVDTTLKNVTFSTLSGDLTVTREDHLYRMTFPPFDLKRVELTQEMIDALGATPTEVYLGRDLLCVFENSEQVIHLKPDIEKVKQLDGVLVHVTAPGNDTDCVSRSFAPKHGIAEDPVCGSGHCHIVPYWAKKLNQTEILAYQASSRGGTLYTTFKDGVLTLAGEAVLFAKSELYI